MRTVTQRRGFGKAVDDLRSLLEESTLAEGESFIRSFIKDVYVTGKERFY
jgi:hypothetical protein